MRIRILLGLFGSLALATTAFAAPQTDPVTGALSVAVSKGGMDLSRADNARTMLARLTQAASTVCGGEPRPMELDRAADYRACMAETLGAAVDHTNSPVVAALYHTGATTAVASSGVSR